MKGFDVISGALVVSEYCCYCCCGLYPALPHHSPLSPMENIVARSQDADHRANMAELNLEVDYSAFVSFYFTNFMCE